MSEPNNFCGRCGEKLDTNNNFCPKCGISVHLAESNKEEQIKQTSTTSINPTNEENKVEASDSRAIAMGLAGFFIVLIGMGIIANSLYMPTLIAGQYMILGLFVAVIGGLTVYGGSRTIKKNKSDSSHASNFLVWFIVPAIISIIKEQTQRARAH